jgi:coenzyme F420-dependent glucose-6-phosphate dehydrogenase
VPYRLLWELAMPEHFDAAAAQVRPADLARAVVTGTDLGRHAEHIAECLALGFDRVLLHNVGTNQREFIEAFGAKVLPQLAGGT